MTSRTFIVGAVAWLAFVGMIVAIAPATWPAALISVAFWAVVIEAMFWAGDGRWDWWRRLDD